MEDSRPAAVRLVLSAGGPGVQIRKWLRKKGNKMQEQDEQKAGWIQEMWFEKNMYWKCFIFFLPLYFTKHLYKELLFGTLSIFKKNTTHTCHMTAPFTSDTSLQPCSAALRWRRCHPLTLFFFFAFLTISKRFSLRATLPTAFCFDWLTQAICITAGRTMVGEKNNEWDLSRKVFFVSGFTSSALSMDMHLLLKCFETLVVVVRPLPVCWEADQALCSSHRPPLPALRRFNLVNLRLKRKNVQIKSSHFLKKKKKKSKASKRRKGLAFPIQWEFKGQISKLGNSHFLISTCCQLSNMKQPRLD